MITCLQIRVEFTAEFLIYRCTKVNANFGDNEKIDATGAIC